MRRIHRLASRSLAREEVRARVALVVAGMSGLGALTGAITAAAVVGTHATAAGGVPVDPGLAGILLGAAAVGAFFGAVAIPTVLFAFLRRVALGRALPMLAGSTIVGSLIGQSLHRWAPNPAVLPGIFLGAIGGLLLGALAMRIAARAA